MGLSFDIIKPSWSSSVISVASLVIRITKWEYSVQGQIRKIYDFEWRGREGFI